MGLHWNKQSSKQHWGCWWSCWLAKEILAWSHLYSEWSKCWKNKNNLNVHVVVNFFILLNFCFSFVLNSLAYSTIPKKTYNIHISVITTNMKWKQKWLSSWKKMVWKWIFLLVTSRYLFVHSKWLANHKFVQTNGHLSRTLSVDQLLFRALNKETWLASLTCKLFSDTSGMI